MVEIGLTGGIGSGKSSVAALLVEKGAILIDADAIVRELQEPGQPVFNKMVEHFGQEAAVNEEGALNRQKIADIVFNDPKQLEILNGIVHPALQNEMDSRRESHKGTGNKLIIDFPLLAESSYRGFSSVIVVDVDPQVAMERLMEHRGFKREDAEARMSRQAKREDRLKLADFVIDNSGTLEDLKQQVRKCWEWICTLDSGKQ